MPSHEPSEQDFFVPLKMEDCWERSRELFRKHRSLYLHIAAFTVLPIKLFFVLLFPISLTDSHYGDYSLLEVVVVGLSGLIASGPIALATAAIYLKQRPSDDEGGWDWTACLAILWQDTELSSKLLTASTLAILGVCLGSVFLYFPGLYLAVDWFFCPCVALFEGKRNKSSIDVLTRSKALSKVSRATLYFSLVLAFLAYAIPSFLLAGCSVLVYELVRGHVLFGHESLAGFLGFVFFVLPSAAFKVVVLPHLLIYKTILYIDFCIKKQRLTEDEFRSNCRQIKSTIFADAGSTDMEHVALTKQEV